MSERVYIVTVKTVIDGTKSVATCNSNAELADLLTHLDTGQYSVHEIKIIDTNGWGVVQAKEFFKMDKDLEMGRK